MATKSDSLFKRLRVYGLLGNSIILIALVTLFLCSLFVYLSFKNEPVLSLSLSIFTSLLASIICISADLIIKYIGNEHDAFVGSMRDTGIRRLHFEKQITLNTLIRTAKKELSFTGYRLILTKDLLPSILCAQKARVSIRLLISPFWGLSYKLIYGDSRSERIIDNYSMVLDIMNNCPSTSEVRFLDVPFFSDTYIIDDIIITGPFLHVFEQIKTQKISAKSFYTYEIEPGKPAHHLFKEEFENLWTQAKSRVDWDLYIIMSAELRSNDLNYAEQVKLFRSCLAPL